MRCGSIQSGRGRASRSKGKPGAGQWGRASAREGAQGAAEWGHEQGPSCRPAGGKIGEGARKGRGLTRGVARSERGRGSLGLALKKEVGRAWPARGKERERSVGPRGEFGLGKGERRGKGS
jgi:hypothetical protein